MDIRILVVLCCLLAPAAQAAPLVNSLQNHASPYLALHGGDPTAWQDWQVEAVERARREGKLIFLSIGYFSCHWCHVMQQESYRNAEIAAYLNTHFIPVKIDRELEPALDARLINFVENTRGISGWPLNVFVTPDGYPLYATLYSPPAEFLAVLKQLQDLWQSDREELKKLARQGVAKRAGPGQPKLDSKQVNAHVAMLLRQVLAQADIMSGGFGQQNKFPSVPQLDMLLKYLEHNTHPEIDRFLRLTLDHMASGGLRDHLGGGFFRYTVDPGWRIPHFEKMLYDNALLARLYMNAGKQLGHEPYLRVARETLDFIVATLRTESGAMVASLSAVDNEGVEGGYYLWHKDELKQRLADDEYAIVVRAWGLKNSPDLEAGHHLVAAAELSGDSKKILQAARTKLLAVRRQRQLPVDGKLLAGWNGLALTAFVQAAREFSDDRYRKTAKGLRDYLVNVLWDGNNLYRARIDGKAYGKVALEDYAYVGQGLLAWAHLTGDEADYRLARRVTDRAWELFYDKGWRLGSGSLIQEEAGADLVYDGPMPSPAAVLMRSRLVLAAHYNDAPQRRQVLSALNTGHDQLQENPFWYASHLSTMMSVSGK